MRKKSFYQIIYLTPLRLHSSKKDPIRSGLSGLRLFTWRVTLLPKSQRKTYKRKHNKLNREKKKKKKTFQIYSTMKGCAQWTSTSATPLVDTLHTFPLSQTPVLLAAQNISASQRISCGSDLEKRLFSVSWILQTLHAKWQRYDWTPSTWPK